MDFLRNGKISKMRLWRDDPTEILVRWSRVPRSAGVFTEPTYFRSSTWEPYKVVTPVGEDKDNGQSWDRGQNPVGYTGQHFCGPLDAIQFGGVHGVTPTITTNADGSCDCCKAAVQVAPVQDGEAPQWKLISTVPVADGTAPDSLQGSNILFGRANDGDAPVSQQAYLYISCWAIGYGFGVGGTNWLVPYLSSLVAANLTCKFGDGNAPNAMQGPTVGLRAWASCTISGTTVTINSQFNMSGIITSGVNQIVLNVSTVPPTGYAARAITVGRGQTAGNPLVCDDSSPTAGSLTLSFYDAVTTLPDLPVAFNIIYAW